MYITILDFASSTTENTTYNIIDVEIYHKTQDKTAEVRINQMQRLAVTHGF